MTNAMLKMKVSLCDTINEWINKQAEDGTDGWEELAIPIGDLTAELMTDSAMNILLSQKTHNEYLYQNDMLKEI